MTKTDSIFEPARMEIAVRHERLDSFYCRLGLLVLVDDYHHRYRYWYHDNDLPSTERYNPNRHLSDSSMQIHWYPLLLGVAHHHLLFQKIRIPLFSQEVLANAVDP